MNLSDITIVFTFYCEGEVRRKYLQLCLKSVFGENNHHNISILVVDGSPADVREGVNGIGGVCSIINFLEKFGDIKQLDRLIFTPDKKMPLE